MIEYRLIPEFSDYCAGNDGSIWSNKSGKWMLLSPSIDKRGRARYRLSIDSNESYFFGSQLVLMAFIGPCPKGMEACHNNGDNTNNCLYNVRWDTHKNNIADKKKHGTYTCGENHHSAKLTDNEIEEIKSLYSVENLTQREIAEIFDVSQGQIQKILTQKRKLTV